MRSFRSKSLVLRGRKSALTVDPLPDFETLVSVDKRQNQQKSTINQAFRFPQSSAAPLPDPDRPVTASGLPKPNFSRDSFSRPRTAGAHNKRDLVLSSLRKHDIDPQESHLIDNECIGVALGSPTESSFHTAAASPVVPTITSSELDASSNDQSSLRRERLGPKSRPRSNTWKAMSSLFGRKRQTADEPAPPPPPPPPPVPSLPTNPMAVEQAQIYNVPEVPPATESYAPRLSSHFSRRRKSEVDARPRKSLTLRRKQKHEKEDDIPALPVEPFPAFEPPSLGEIDIPTSAMDRFSIMFGSVLQDQRDLPPPKRDSKGFLPLIAHHSSSNKVPQVSVVQGSPKPSPPPAYDLPPAPDAVHPLLRRSSDTGPPALFPDQVGHFSPRAAPHPPPPPPSTSPPLDQFPMFNRRRDYSVSSNMTASTASTIPSPASLLSTELEHYYLPTTTAGRVQSSDTAPSSSRSSQTFPLLLEEKPEEPTPQSRTISPAPSTIEDNENDAMSLLNSQLTVTSAPSSSYVSARAFPSPSSSVHHLQAPISPRVSLYLHQHQQHDPLNPYSPSSAYGYSDPHSPLLEMARSAPTAVRAGSTLQGRARIVSRDLHATAVADDLTAHSANTRRMPLGEARCSTPRVVCVDETQRRMSQWGLLDS